MGTYWVEMNASKITILSLRSGLAGLKSTSVRLSY